MSHNSKGSPTKNFRAGRAAPGWLPAATAVRACSLEAMAQNDSPVSNPAQPAASGRYAGSALVLGGGGARAAYHAGFLRRLGELQPGLHFPILTGVSAGAINTASLASGRANFAVNAARLAEFWENITAEQVFRADWAALGLNMLRWFGRLDGGGTPLASTTRSLMDTGPLRAFLSPPLARDGGRLLGVAENIRRGRIDAVALVTTNYATGVSTSWVESRRITSWIRPGRCGLPADLTLDHVMASASLPLFFPAVKLANAWHGDGGVRLQAPFSPAIHLGAQRIVALSTRPLRPHYEADPVQPLPYPSPASVIGLLLDAVFLDAVEQDELHLRRVNALARTRDTIAEGALRRVELLVVRPSVDLAPMARKYEAELPRAFRFATRGLGTREAAQSELLATLMFNSGYVREVMAIGARDAEARHREIAAFLAGETPVGF